VRAVIFDLFGTLVENPEPQGWKGAFDAIAEHLGAEPDEFWTAWGSTFPARMDGSLADDDQVFAGTTASLGLQPSADTLREAARMRADFMRTCIRIKDDALDCLDALLAQGMRLALATDCSSGTPTLLDQTPLGKYLPIRAVSAHLGVRKPHPAMYEHVLTALGLPGEECWYVGDGNSEELPGAKRHGMTTVWIDNGERQHHKERFVPGGDHTIRKLSELPALIA